VDSFAFSTVSWPGCPEASAAGALPANLDWKKAYTLQFVKDL